MNGCQGNPRDRVPIGSIETRTFPAVTSPALATDTLNLAISELKANPPLFTSGILRLQVCSTHFFSTLTLLQHNMV
jgi:menaquinone-specific isochorismate synthase